MRECKRANGAHLVTLLRHPARQDPSHRHRICVADPRSLSVSLPGPARADGRHDRTAPVRARSRPAGPVAPANPVRACNVSSAPGHWQMPQADPPLSCSLLQSAISATAFLCRPSGKCAPSVVAWRSHDCESSRCCCSPNSPFALALLAPSALRHFKPHNAHARGYSSRWGRRAGQRPTTGSAR